MAAHRGDVLLQRAFAGVLIVGIEVALIGNKGHFGIDNHIFTLREPNDDVRLHPGASFGFDANLGFILIARPQAGRLQHAGQHHLAPVTLRFIIALQGAGQVDRFLRHLGIKLL